MNKKILKVIGTVCAFIFFFILYFLYDKFPNFITSILSKINNSIFQYTKILFGSIILSGVTQKIIMIVKKDKINNICLSNFIGALLSIFIFIIMSLPFYNTINNIYIIIIIFITIVLSQIISYVIMNKKDLKMENKTIFLVIIVYIIFTLLTYFPLKNILFYTFNALV